MRPLPGPDYRSLREAFRRGEHKVVLASGEKTMARLAGDTGQRTYLPSAMLMIGASLVELEHHPDAVVWLEQGLVRVEADPLDPQLGLDRWFHELLADTYLFVGRWSEAEAYLAWLAEPHQRVESRLAATRGQLALASARGRFDEAQWLVNTAADLARRSRNNLASAMVDADRAMVLAAENRLHEAVRTADEVGPALASPGVSAVQCWANRQAATMYTYLARQLAKGGDLMTAQRYLLEAGAPVATAGRAACVAHLTLAHSVVRREESDLVGAEAPMREAVARLEELGARPALAVALVEQAELARRQGLDELARSIAARARAEQAALDAVPDDSSEKLVPG